MKIVKNFENVFQIWQNYKESALKFAVYQKENYPVFGLDSEIGELLGKYAKYFLRGDKGDFIPDFISEIGDCFWMLAAIDERIKNLRIFNRYHIESRDFEDIRLNLLENLAEKKYHLIFEYLLQLLAYYDVAFEFVLNKNIEKLTDRLNRGVIQGKGDKR